MTTTWDQARSSRLRITAAVLLMFFGSVTHADGIDYRVSAATAKFDDTIQLAVAFHVPSPQALGIDRMEFAAGILEVDGTARPFASFGPVWQLPWGGHRWFAEFGFSPTVLSGSSPRGRDIGGNLHFTSSIAAGLRFGKFNDKAVALRFQHISNGGLNSTNPGLDMVGLNFSYSPAPR